MRYVAAGINLGAKSQDTSQLLGIHLVEKKTQPVPQHTSLLFASFDLDNSGARSLRADHFQQKE